MAFSFSSSQSSSYLMMISGVCWPMKATWTSVWRTSANIGWKSDGTM